MTHIISKDYRKKDNLKWLNDNYFIAIYDYNDNFICTFENIDDIPKVFNISLKKILFTIKHKLYFTYNNVKLKLFLIEKEKINENYKRK